MTESDNLLKRILTEMSYVDLVSASRSPFGKKPYLVIDAKLVLTESEYELTDRILKECDA